MDFFFINRIRSTFAGVPVHFSLKKTLNAHAKSCLKGVIAYADINSGVNRWHLRNAMRSETTNALLKIANLKLIEGGQRNRSYHE